MAYPWDFDTPVWYEWSDRYPLFTPEPGSGGGEEGPTYESAADPSGTVYGEYYLYSNKAWEMAPSGVSFVNLQNAIMQNAPIVITPSGYETTSPVEAWAKVSGAEKYQKVGYGYFDVLPNGQYDPESKQFAMSPDASGKLVFNGPLRENVYIEYEAGASGYYIVNTIDYNPIRAEVAGGFVHFSQTTEPAFISLSASQTSLIADGYDNCTITAILFDADLDRVPNKGVIFEIQNLPLDYWSEYGYLTPNEGTVLVSDPSGYAVYVEEQTNSRGEVHVHYVTHESKAGVPQIKAYYDDPAGASGVYDIVGFYQFYLSSQPFTLDVSLLDTIDYLT